MQIRNHPKPLGMTGMSNALDTLWTHQYRARVPPWGVNRADATCVNISNFFTKKSPSNFSTKNVTTRINPHPPPLSDVSHNSILVDIGVYG
jgi:hypothetical protein